MGQTTPPRSRQERLLGYLAGKMLVRGARLALKRGDTHLFDHIRAAVRVGNTGPHSHDDGCWAHDVLSQRALSKGREDR